MNSPVTIYSALNLHLFSGGIAVESCLAPGFERARSTIAVLEKLDVGHLSPLKARQHAKRRRDFLPSYVRFVGKRAEEGDAATLLDGIGDLEVECFPEALDCRKDIRQSLWPFVSAGPRLNFLEFGVVEIQRNVGSVRCHELLEHLEIRCVLQKLLKHSGQVGRHEIVPPSSFVSSWRTKLVGLARCAVRTCRWHSHAECSAR